MKPAVEYANFQNFSVNLEKDKTNFIVKVERLEDLLSDIHLISNLKAINRGNIVKLTVLEAGQ